MADTKWTISSEEALNRVASLLGDAKTLAHRISSMQSELDVLAEHTDDMLLRARVGTLRSFVLDVRLELTCDDMLYLLDNMYDYCKAKENES